MSYSIHYYPQAEDALSSLDSEERNRVLTRIHMLAECGLSDPNIARLKDITEENPTYVLRTGNDLLVAFTVGQDSITVLDILNRRFAERYG